MVFSTPVRAIEAWIIAALYPQENKPENIADPAKWLVTKKKLRPSKIGLFVESRAVRFQ